MCCVFNVNWIYLYILYFWFYTYIWIAIHPERKLITNHFLQHIQNENWYLSAAMLISNLSASNLSEIYDIRIYTFTRNYFTMSTYLVEYYETSRLTRHLISEQLHRSHVNSLLYFDTLTDQRILTDHPGSLCYARHFSKGRLLFED